MLINPHIKLIIITIASRRHMCTDRLHKFSGSYTLQELRAQREVKLDCAGRHRNCDLGYKKYTASLWEINY